ncbi:MAG TPA: UvrD-helicase domain-containing protein, partial [Thermoanaerobaculia bacterium]|nr:UvrD-helicase domain-containing protein [Thermoanaerobaculia bacterium]
MSPPPGDKPGGAPRVFYLTPDHPAPSWGVGLLYEHVRLLREVGFDARVLHQRRPFRVSWLESEAPVEYLDDESFAPRGEDVLVVPEVLAAEAAQRPWPGRRGVFVQGSFLALRGHAAAIRYGDLGFDFALAVLPHVAAVVERHFGLGAAVVPPFVAPHADLAADQLAAVSHLAGPARIIAPAGSGKTRVLTERLR